MNLQNIKKMQNMPIFGNISYSTIVSLDHKYVRALLSYPLMQLFHYFFNNSKLIKIKINIYITRLKVYQGEIHTFK